MSNTAPGVGDRQGYIGGSDVAGILSLSPFSTPFRVFASKVGSPIAEAKDPVREEKFDWGHALEPAIAEGFARRYRREIRRSPEPFYRHPVHQFMGAHVDFESASGPGGPWNVLVECKNVEFDSDEWGKPHEDFEQDASDLVPLYYLAQVDHYMIVRDYSYAYLVALFGGCHMRVYRINRNPAREELIIRSEEVFWKRVVDDEPPPFSGLDDLLLAQRAGYIETYNSKRAKAEKVRIELDKIGLAILDEVYRESRAENAAKKKRETARRALIAHLEGRTGYLYAGKEKHGSFLMGERTSFDSFSFELENPELHAKYSRKVPVGPILRLPKDKNDDADS